MSSLRGDIWLVTMFKTELPLGQYSLVASDLEDELDNETPQHKDVRRNSRSSRRLVIFVLFLSLTSLAVGFTSGVLLSRQIASDKSHGFTTVSACNRPQYRREWRSLSYGEKHDYIQAVQCLTQTPSRLGQNQSLYDDFPYVHFRVGGYCTLLPIFDRSY